MVYVLDETAAQRIPITVYHTSSTTFITAGMFLLGLSEFTYFKTTLAARIKSHTLCLRAMEHVEQQYLDYLCVSFMIVGNTNFDVDRAFSATAKAYNSSDIFTTLELAEVMSQSPSITSLIDNGKLVKLMILTN